MEKLSIRGNDGGNGNIITAFPDTKLLGIFLVLPQTQKQT